jgi:hypothetical protein
MLTVHHVLEWSASVLVYLIHFFIFFAQFFARLASKFEKSTNQKGYQKMQNFMLISNPLKFFL